MVKYKATEALLQKIYANMSLRRLCLLLLGIFLTIMPLATAEADAEAEARAEAYSDADALLAYLTIPCMFDETSGTLKCK